MNTSNPTKQELHDALNHLQQSNLFIEDQQESLRLLEYFISTKRRALNYARKNPPLKPGWYYRPGSKFGWYYTGKRYVWVKDGKVPPKE